MSEPRVEVIPVRPAVCADQEITLDVLVRIIPPAPEIHFVRPTLNLSVVLDHSGSMAGAKKMDYARQAAAFAVEQLLPTDHLSVTIFDDAVETIVPHGPVTNKPDTLRKIATIQPRGSTALHEGWSRGASNVLEHKVLDGLNRVLLLSDGLANVGLTDPNAIAADVGGLNAKGISTTTLGVGDDYNEDLMEAMATAGDGNYYFISDPVQLTDIFQTELQGLVATHGTKVTLTYTPASQTRQAVVVSDMLNDLPKDDQGRWKLPNLVVGNPILALFRLKAPGQGTVSAAPVDLGRFRIEWDEPSKGRRSLEFSLSLPVLEMARWDQLGQDAAVQEQVALFMSARAKREAIQAYDRGDFAATRAYIGEAAACFAPLAATCEIDAELADIQELQANLDANQNARFRKMSAYQAHNRGASKPRTPPKSS